MDLLQIQQRCVHHERIRKLLRTHRAHIVAPQAAMELGIRMLSAATDDSQIRHQADLSEVSVELTFSISQSLAIPLVVYVPRPRLSRPQSWLLSNLPWE